MQLIEGWKTAYKLYSVQLAVLIAALGAVQMYVLPTLKVELTPDQYALVNVVLGTVLGAARLIKQGGDELNTTDTGQSS